MAELGGTVVTAAGVFAGTNVDAFLLLVVLFLGSRDGGLRTWQIVLGQYLAFTALVSVSAAAAAGLAAVPVAWVGVLGVVPLALGVRSSSRSRTTSAASCSTRPPATSWAAPGDRAASSNGT
jgi:cadmium resistance protein CadD (predicted permease)